MLHGARGDMYKPHKKDFRLLTSAKLEISTFEFGQSSVSKWLNNHQLLVSVTPKRKQKTEDNCMLYFCLEVLIFQYSQKRFIIFAKRTLFTDLYFKGKTREKYI